ncbi:unnamed protein product [Mycena citricolor]|uniref:Uncharacterized protein n=1 Tax=Mycena citricolor TaxID=2018698 RepID=A0AAD2JZC5_9AGAR|nr:unnamed protein product [Mycena citricolor]
MLYTTLLSNKHGYSPDSVPRSNSRVLHRLLNEKSQPCRDAVRHVILIHIDPVSDVLGKCSLIEDAFVLCPLEETVLPRLQQLPHLRRLHCDAHMLTYLDRSGGILPALTHLEVLRGTFETPAQLRALAERIPRLTHFACNQLREHDLALCVQILQRIPALEVFVIIDVLDDLVLLSPEREAVFEGNLRLVWVSMASYVEDWVQGAIGRVDFWQRADELVQRRTSGTSEDGAFRV